MLRYILIGLLAAGVARASVPVDMLQAPVAWQDHVDAVRVSPAVTVALDTLPIVFASGDVLQLAGASAPGHLASTVFAVDESVSRAHGVFAVSGTVAPASLLARLPGQVVVAMGGSLIGWMAAFDASGTVRWVRGSPGQVLAAAPDAWWILNAGQLTRIGLDGRTVGAVAMDVLAPESAAESRLVGNDDALFVVQQIGWPGASVHRVLIEARAKDSGSLLWREEVAADPPAIGCVAADAQHLYVVGRGGASASPVAGAPFLEVRSVTDGSVIRRHGFVLSNVDGTACVVVFDGQGGAGILFGRSTSSTLARVDTEGLAWARMTTLGSWNRTRIAWMGSNLLVAGNRAGSAVLRVERFTGGSGASSGHVEIPGGVIDGNVDLVRGSGEWIIARPYPGGVERLRVGDDMVLRSTSRAASASVTPLVSAYVADGSRVHELSEIDLGSASGLRVRTRDALDGQVLFERTLPGLEFGTDWLVQGASLSVQGNDLLLNVSALPAAASGSCSSRPRRTLVMLDLATLAVRWYDSLRVDVEHRAELGADGLVILAGRLADPVTCAVHDAFTVEGRSAASGQSLWSRAFPGGSRLLGAHGDAVVVDVRVFGARWIETLASTTGQTDWTVSVTSSSNPMRTFAILPQRVHLFGTVGYALAATAYARATGEVEFRSEVSLDGESAITTAAAAAGQRLLLTGTRSEFIMFPIRQAPVFALVDADTGHLRAQRLFPRIWQADWWIRPADQRAQAVDPRVLVSNLTHYSSSSLRTVGLMRVDTTTGAVSGEHVLWSIFPRMHAAYAGWTAIDRVDVLADGSVLLGGRKVDPENGLRQAIARLAMPPNASGNLSLAVADGAVSSVGMDIVRRVVVDNASDIVAGDLRLWASDSAVIADIVACAIEGTGACPTTTAFDRASLALGPRSRAQIDVRLGTGRHPASVQVDRVSLGLATASSWSLGDEVRGDTIGDLSIRLGPYADGFE